MPPSLWSNQFLVCARTFLHRAMDRFTHGGRFNFSMASSDMSASVSRLFKLEALLNDTKPSPGMVWHSVDLLDFLFVSTAFIFNVATVETFMSTLTPGGAISRNTSYRKRSAPTVSLLSIDLYDQWPTLPHPPSCIPHMFDVPSYNRSARSMTPFLSTKRHT